MADRDTPAIRRYPFLPPNFESGWAPYLWLVYLVQFWIYPLVTPVSKLHLWSAIVATLLFLPLYFLAYWFQGRRLLLIIAAICAIGCVCSTWNPCACMFFIYAGFLTGQFRNPRHGAYCLVAIIALIIAETWALHFPVAFWVPAISFTTFGGIMMIYRRQQNRMRRQLDMAHSEVERLAKIAERERIARDLHDLLGHTLSLIVLKSELASRLAEIAPVRAAEEIRDVERISRDALAQVRSAVRGYRSAGLAAELEYARETLAAAGIHFEYPAGPLRLSPSQESVLVLAVREAVTNIIRHAQATSCRLFLRSQGDAYEFEMIDDGRGSTSAEGFGLTGMRERVESLGGTLERDGSRGMRLFIRLPLQSPATGAA